MIGLGLYELLAFQNRRMSRKTVQESRISANVNNVRFLTLLAVAYKMCGHR